MWGWVRMSLVKPWWMKWLRLEVIHTGKGTWVRPRVGLDHSGIHLDDCCFDFGSQYSMRSSDGFAILGL